MTHALALALIPLFAVADRMVGGAGRRSIAFATVLIVGLLFGFLTHLWPVAILSAVWCGYRSLPFKPPFGSTTPHGAEIATTVFRHALPALVALAFGLDHAFGADWTTLSILLGFYAVAATVLALVYAWVTDAHVEAGTPGGGENAIIEPVRGAAFGVALAAWAVLA